MSRVVARSQADISSIAKSAHLCRQNISRLGGNTKHTPKRREVGKYSGDLARLGVVDVHDTYARTARKLPQTLMHATGSKPPIGYAPQPDDIVFTQADTRWVHNPHEDAMIIISKIANNLIHRLLVDSGSAVNILYRGAYKKTSLRQADLTPMTSPLYEFTGDSIIQE